MNLLDKLEMLMKHKGINKRQLSIGSDIPYSTIDNLWKKGYENIKLSTLKKLAIYFSVSLDFLVESAQREPNQECPVDEVVRSAEGEQKENAPETEVSEAADSMYDAMVGLLVESGKVKSAAEITNSQADALAAILVLLNELFQ